MLEFTAALKKHGVWRSIAVSYFLPLLWFSSFLNDVSTEGCSQLIPNNCPATEDKIA